LFSKECKDKVKRLKKHVHSQVLSPINFVVSYLNIIILSILTQYWT